MKKLSILNVSILTLLSVSLLANTATVFANIIETPSQSTTAETEIGEYDENLEETDVQIYYISTKKAFEIAESEGVDVKGALGEEEYNKALRQDMLRVGSSYIKTFKVGKETRISIGANSALVKTWKISGRATILAIQAYGAAVGMPLDAMVASGMHNQLKSVNGTRGYQWTIGTKPWRIISSGTQNGGGGRDF